MRRVFWWGDLRGYFGECARCGNTVAAEHHGAPARDDRTGTPSDRAPDPAPDRDS